MIKTTQWSPDTCGCTITYEWDTEQKEEERTHTISHATPCEYHIAHPTNHLLFNAVKKENTEKNIAYEEACQAKPDLLPEHFKFSHDTQRKLNLEITGVSDVDLTAIKSRIAKRGIDVNLQQKNG